VVLMVNPVLQDLRVLGEILDPLGMLGHQGTRALLVNKEPVVNLALREQTEIMGHRDKQDPEETPALRGPRVLQEIMDHLEAQDRLELLDRLVLQDL